MECKDGKNKKLLIKDFDIVEPDKHNQVEFLLALINENKNVGRINLEPDFNMFSGEPDGYTITIKWNSNKLPKHKTETT